MTTSPSPLLHRQREWILVSLVILSAGSWIAVLWQGQSIQGQSTGLTMGMDITLFIVVWVTMMAAMMLPAATPMILMFAQVQAGKRRQGRPVVSIQLFAASYLALWSAVGTLAYSFAVGAQLLGNRVAWFGDHGPQVGGLLLVAAGIYQFTPLKRACLTQCRSPLAFVMTSWRDGSWGAVRMGLTHGLYCLGCCWLLFAILFPLGMMNIAVLAVVTLLIFAERVLPYGIHMTWLAAAVMIAYGVAILVFPDLLPMQAHPEMQM